MELNKLIDEIYNVLIQYEKIAELDSGVDEESYKGYLNRLWVWYNGYGNDDITNSLKGLHKLGAEADHDTVRRTVFHIISLLKRNGAI